MPNPQSSLIIKRYDAFGGNFIDSDYLAAAYETGKPTYLEGMMMQTYSSQSRFMNLKPLLNLVGMNTNGGKEIETERVRWYLHGAEDRDARVIELVETSNTTPGLNGTTFRIKLDLDYFHFPDVLIGTDNDLPCQITEGPIPDGTGYIYTMKLITDNPTLYVLPADISAGAIWSKVTTAVPAEYNQWFGTQQYPNVFLLEAQLGSFAQSLHVTDKAWRDSGRLGVKFGYTNANGQYSEVNKFIPYAESKMVDEFYRSIEWSAVYGKKSTQAGPDKYPILTGNGLREQLRDGYTQLYSGPLSVTLLQDYLMSIFFGKADETQRDVKVMTGTLGSILFHNALAAVANGFLTVDTHYVREMPSKTSTPWLAYGAEFRRYTGPSGIAVDLMLNPMYDSIQYCKQFHPQYPDMPIDSARMTFLDFGGNGVAKNIELLKVKDSFYYGYKPGMLSPSGPIKNNGMFGDLKAGYDTAIQGSFGIVMRDVTRGGELILSAE